MLSHKSTLCSLFSLHKNDIMMPDTLSVTDSAHLSRASVGKVVKMPNIEDYDRMEWISIQEYMDSRFINHRLLLIQPIYNMAGTNKRMIRNLFNKINFKLNNLINLILI